MAHTYACARNAASHIKAVLDDARVGSSEEIIPRSLDPVEA
jgi:hypothetical protein